jgi:4-diphosphocytidyl-2-C-methyl-D-erythritol kinase
MSGSPLIFCLYVTNFSIREGEKLQDLTKNITLKSFAKINLSINVLGELSNGYHEVDMIMQQVDIYDKVHVSWTPEEEWSINVSTNRRYLPTDQRNIAYKAVESMIDFVKGCHKGKIEIKIDKRIPVAAGLAGGSSNGAVVLLALNHLWNLELDVKNLCEIGAKIGADVPFCLMGCARNNKLLGDRINNDYLACSCARARGIGTDLEPIEFGLKVFVVLTKPPISVSTREVYEGLDLSGEVQRPDNDELINGLKEKNYYKVKKNMINVLEIYTINKYPIIMYTKNKTENIGKPLKVLMSGSGPTVFAIYTSKEKARLAMDYLKQINKETYLARTL